MGNGAIDINKFFFCCINKENKEKKDEVKFPPTLKKAVRDVKEEYNPNIILKSLNEISQNQLITRSDEIKEKFNKMNLYSNFNKYNNNEFVPINYEIIPEKINNNMFDQGPIGICYLVAGVNAFRENSEYF